MATELIVALDFDDAKTAMQLVDAAGDAVEWFKVGKQLFTREGPGIVKSLKERGKKVFLDLKFHDIPNTVAQAVKSAAASGADMTNVHALGGPEMLKAAAVAGRETGILVVAVTILTSMDEKQMQSVGLSGGAMENVARLAGLTSQCGLPGVVCSALEIETVKKACGADFKLVVPGIRPAGGQRGDQKRVMTPGAATRAGAEFIVVGRPITQAASPVEAAKRILAEITDAESR